MVKLLILGALQSGPQHGYGIQRLIEEGGYEKWTKILPNSIYNALRTLEKGGQIREYATEQQGKKLRVLYEITEAGQSSFRRMLISGIASPQQTFPSKLYLALGYLHSLGEKEIEAALGQRIRELEEAVRQWEAGRERKRMGGEMGEAMEAMFNNGLSHLHADLDFLKYIYRERERLYPALKEYYDQS